MKKARNVLLTFLCIVMVGCGIPRLVIQFMQMEASIDTEGMDGISLQLYERYPDNEDVLYIVKHRKEYEDDLLSLLLEDEEWALFVRYYPTHQNLNRREGLREDEVKGDNPLFLQKDIRWGYEKYGDDMIAKSGCGPTALAMVFASLLHEKAYDPYTIAKYCDENGYYVDGVGSSWQMMDEVPFYYGLRSERISVTSAPFYVTNGAHLIISVGPGDFTQSGHFIVVDQIDEDGYVQLRDPNSKKRSAKRWQWEDIQRQAQAIWAISM